MIISAYLKKKGAWRPVYCVFPHEMVKLNRNSDFNTQRNITATMSLQILFSPLVCCRTFMCNTTAWLFPRQAIRNQVVIKLPAQTSGVF